MIGRENPNFEERRFVLWFGNDEGNERAFVKEKANVETVLYIATPSPNDLLLRFYPFNLNIKGFRVTNA